MAFSQQENLRTIIECASIHANDFLYDRTYGFVYDDRTHICQIYSIDDFVTCDNPLYLVYTTPTVTGIAAINLVSQG